MAAWIFADRLVDLTAQCTAFLFAQRLSFLALFLNWKVLLTVILFLTVIQIGVIAGASGIFPLPVHYRSRRSVTIGTGLLSLTDLVLTGQPKAQQTAQQKSQSEHKFQSIKSGIVRARVKHGVIVGARPYMFGELCRKVCNNLLVNQ